MVGHKINRMVSHSKSKIGTKQIVRDTALLVWNSEAEALKHLKESIDLGVLAQCVEAIANCKGRVLTAGCGTSAAAARKIAHSLCCVGRAAAFLAPGDALHGGLGLAQPSDLVILISKGGNTSEIINMLPSLQAKRMCVIGVTENPDSVLGQSADYLMLVKVEREPDEFNMLATASTMAVIAVFDAICISLMKVTGYTKNQFAIIHPGGAVGDRLLAGSRRSKSKRFL